ncbi:MAG TPA: isoprenylcysteine carboxylmethyltransferase family protein [Terriglobia bacterium]|nr:isoprenylcysteine carboxylmethyltransferase family protein [Terriglobia bacterium]
MIPVQQKKMENPFRLLMRVPVPWVFVLTYLLGAGMQWVIPCKVHPGGSFGSGIAGGVLFMIGAVIAGWSWLIFHGVRTTTIPGKLSAKLVTWGPFRLSRNPMYVGLAVAYLGEAGILRQVWPVLLLPLTVAYLNWIVIPVEEARLRDVFQGEYERYCTKVRRWI